MVDFSDAVLGKVFKEFTSNELLIFILLQYGRFMCYRVCKNAPIDLSIKSTGFIQPTCMSCHIWNTVFKRGPSDYFILYNVKTILFAWKRNMVHSCIQCPILTILSSYLSFKNMFTRKIVHFILNLCVLGYQLDSTFLNTIGNMNIVDRIRI